MDQLNIEEQPYVKGVIHTVIYHNDTNLYTVLKSRLQKRLRRSKTRSYP